jgi:L-threonylcarbamoyladenylate synthase
MIDFTNDINQSLEVLQNGGVILYPTDTIWGLGCDATDEAAVEKIVDLKNRPATKSFVVLVADEKQLMQYVAALDLAVFDYLDAQEKPTTVIYDSAIGLATNVLAANGSIAIRICKDEFCKTLIKRFRKPIVSTSANLSGEPSPSLFKEVSEPIVNGVDYVVIYRQNDEIPAQPSSIIKWSNGSIEKIR